MQTYVFTSPEGKKYKITAPSEAEARASLQRHLAKPTQPEPEVVPTPEQAAPQREGYEVVEAFPDGGVIYKGAGGAETYVGPSGSGYSTTDPKTIKQIRFVGGDAASVSRGETAQDIIGEVPTRIASLLKGFSGLRGYVEPIISKGASAVSQMYGEGVSPEQVRGLLDEAIARREAEAPKTVAASRLAGGIASAIPFAPKLAAETIIGKIGQGTTLGLGLGALEGLIAGYGEGGREEAIRQAQTGGQFGALFGGAAPVVAPVVGAAYGRYLEKPVKDIIGEIGFKKDAARVVQDFLEMDAAEAVESAEAAGPYGSVSMLGPNMTALIDYVANSVGKGATIVKQNLKDTSLQASTDLKQAFNTSLGVPTRGLQAQKTQIMADTAEARRELYGKAYDFEIDPETAGGAELVSILNRVAPDDISGAKTLLREAGEDYRFIGGERVSEAQLQEVLQTVPAGTRPRITSNPDGTYTIHATPKVSTLDYVSRKLLSRSQALKRAGDYEDAASKANLARLIRSKLDEINPDYAKARAAGKDAIDQKLAAELGDDILNMRTSRESVAQAVESMDDIAKTQLRQALRNRLDEIMANAKVNPRGTNDAEVVEALAALKALNTRASREKLTMALGEETMSVLSPQIASTTEAMIHHASVATNSKTAIRQLVLDKMNEMAQPSLGDKFRQAGPISTVAGAIVDPLFSRPSRAAQVARLGEEIAPVLTQRLTPRELAMQAQRMEQLAPTIERARQGRASARSMAQSGAFAGGLLQAEQERTPLNLAQRQLGLAR